MKLVQVFETYGVLIACCSLSLQAFCIKFGIFAAQRPLMKSKVGVTPRFKFDITFKS